MTLKKRRIRRFLLWLLPARRVKIRADELRETEPRIGPQNLGGWSDLPYE